MTIFFSQFEQLAARLNMTLYSVIEESLHETLACQQEIKERTPMKLTTFAGNGYNRASIWMIRRRYSL